MLGKLVLTGARGNLGSVLRDPLSRLCNTLVTTDIREAPDSLLPNEHYVRSDLSRMDEVAPLLEGADMVVHFGAIVDEKPFEDLWGPNFVGAYNVWEAAHRQGLKRVVYASSIHAVGMYPTNQGIDTDVPHRPDTFYGLAKCFAEDLGRMYWEKRGLESVHLRILSCTPEPQNTRALGTWLSYGDLVRLVTRAIDTPTTGFSVIYGVSANTRAPVSNARVPFLGYRPEDNAETHAPALFAKALPANPQDMALTRVGGPFAAIPLGESGLAAIRAMTETRGGTNRAGVTGTGGQARHEAPAKDKTKSPRQKAKQPQGTKKSRAGKAK